MMAWAGSRLLFADEQKAASTALLALVGSQLGQTLTSGKVTPSVLAASLGSAALMLGLVETPGISRLFGCRPVGPVCLATALGASTVSAVGVRVVPPAYGRLQKLLERAQSDAR